MAKEAERGLRHERLLQDMVPEARFQAGLSIKANSNDLKLLYSRVHEALLRVKSQTCSRDEVTHLLQQAPRELGTGKQPHESVWLKQLEVKLETWMDETTQRFASMEDMTQRFGDRLTKLEERAATRKRSRELLSSDRLESRASAFPPRTYRHSNHHPRSPDMLPGLHGSVQRRSRHSGRSSNSQEPSVTTNTTTAAQEEPTAIAEKRRAASATAHGVEVALESTTSSAIAVSEPAREVNAVLANEVRQKRTDDTSAPSVGGLTSPTRVGTKPTLATEQSHTKEESPHTPRATSPTAMRNERITQEEENIGFDRTSFGSDSYTEDYDDGEMGTAESGVTRLEVQEQQLQLEAMSIKLKRLEDSVEVISKKPRAIYRETASIAKFAKELDTKLEKVAKQLVELVGSQTERINSVEEGMLELSRRDRLHAEKAKEFRLELTQRQQRDELRLDDMQNQIGRASAPITEHTTDDSIASTKQQLRDLRNALADQKRNFDIERHTLLTELRRHQALYRDMVAEYSSILSAENKGALPNVKSPRSNQKQQHRRPLPPSLEQHATSESPRLTHTTTKSSPAEKFTAAHLLENLRLKEQDPRLLGSL